MRLRIILICIIGIIALSIIRITLFWSSYDITKNSDINTHQVQISTNSISKDVSVIKNLNITKREKDLFISRWSQALYEDIFKVSSNEWLINKDAVLKYISNINQLMKDAKIAPYIVSGKAIGLKIDGLKEDGIIKRAGFQKGDIITMVNGKGVSDIRGAAKKIFDIVRNESKVKVEIKRNNRKEVLNYTIL